MTRLIAGGITFVEGLDRPVVKEELPRYFWQRRAYVDISNESGDALRVDSPDMHFIFNINKTSKEDPNSSYVKIYNLNSQNRNKIDSEGKYLVLHAGYEGNISLLFTGTISDIFHEKIGQDIVTTITSEDGEEAYRNSYVNKTYPAGTKLETILNDLGTSFGVQGKNIRDVPKNFEFKNGVTLSGDIKKYLRELCESAGLEYSIQNGVLEVHTKYGENGSDIVFLSKDHGLIGSPQRYKRKRKKQDEDEEKGVKIVSLLQPKIIPSSIIKVESMFLNGYFIVKEVGHNGSASKNASVTDYYSEMVAYEII